VAALTVLTACSDGISLPATTTTTTAGEGGPGAPGTIPVETLPDVADELPVLEDVTAPAWEPTTRSEQLMDEINRSLAAGEELTVQQAVDAYSLAIVELPGATPTELPAGDEIDATWATNAISMVREELTAEQRAALDASRETEGPPVTVSPASASAPAAPELEGSTTTVAGLRHRAAQPLSPQLVRVATLLAQAMNEWFAYRPDLPRPVAVVDILRISSTKFAAQANAIRPAAEACRIEVFRRALRESDAFLVQALSHEYFHCMQFRWDPNHYLDRPLPDWLVEGSAKFADFDLALRSGRQDAGNYLSLTSWFTAGAAPLDSRSYSAWPLYATYQAHVGDPYEAIAEAFASGGPETPRLLESSGLGTMRARTFWSTAAYRSTRYPPEWTVPWMTPSRTGGPQDLTVARGTRGIGRYRVASTPGFSHPQFVVTMSRDVGVVTVTARGSTFSTHTRDGTVHVAEGDSDSFCFAPGGCVCPGGGGTGAHPMAGRAMAFSFAAALKAPFGQVVATRWDPDEMCEQPRDRRGSSNGDPHLTTFDGLGFDVHALGEFTLVRGDGFEVQTRHEPIPFGATNTAVAIGIGGSRVTFTVADMGDDVVVVRVDGEEVDPAGSFDVGGVAVDRSPPGHAPRWDLTLPDGTTIEVRYRSSFFVAVGLATDDADVEGLLPAPNGDMFDDLTLPDGTVLDEYDRRGIDEEYAPPWLVDDRTTLFDYAPGESPRTFREAERVTPRPPDDDALARCRDRLGDLATTFEVFSCGFDLSATGDETYLDAYAEEVADREDSIGAPGGPAASPPPDVPSAPEQTTTTAPPAPVEPVSGAPTLVLEGVLWDGISPTSDRTAVAALAGSVRLEDGAVVVLRAGGCPADMDLTVELHERETDAGRRLDVCDPNDLNGALAGEDDEVVDDEVYAWTTSGGVYDVTVTTYSSTPAPVRLELFTDPEPVVVDADDALAAGWTGTLDGVGDTAVLLPSTGDTGATWAIDGLDEACGAELYGPVFGDPGTWPVAFCAHRSGSIAIGVSGDLVVPILVFARTDEPIDVRITPKG